MKYSFSVAQNHLKYLRTYCLPLGLIQAVTSSKNHVLEKERGSETGEGAQAGEAERTSLLI